MVIMSQIVHIRDAHQIDAISGAKINIPSEHHHLHEGESFERHIDSANLAVASLNVAFKTAPGLKHAHMLFGFSSNDEILFEVLEGATWDQGSGTALNLSNHNRAFAKILGAEGSSVILEDKNQVSFLASDQFIKNVTNVIGDSADPDIRFEGQYTYNASQGQRFTAETRAAHHEWKLAPDMTYVVRMTQTDGNCKMSIDLHWYEHTDTNSIRIFRR